MNVINAEFEDIASGEKFKIIDVYHNIAITDSKEKIDVRRLTDSKYYRHLSKVNESVSNFRSESKEDVIDPEDFLRNTTMYMDFSSKIKSIPLDRIPLDAPTDTQVTVRDYGSAPVDNQSQSNNDNIVSYTNEQDEREELMRKYGVTSVDQDAVRHQNETFTRILDPEGAYSTDDNQEYVETKVQYTEPIQERNTNFQRQEDPIVTMFKNIKRSVDFNIEFKLTGKIPRIDFIEMMEDSYEVSIVEYLADEFTNKLLSDPSQIRSQILEKIKSLMSKTSEVESNVEEKVIKTTKAPRKSSATGKTTSKKNNTKVNDNTGTSA